MPPKAHFSKEQILECALEIAREEGLQKLSARSLAQRLGCSTSPIYTVFQTMSELGDLVCERSTGVMLEYQTKTLTGSPLLDMCLGYVLFAIGEKQLFRDMFLNKSELSEHSRRMKDLAFSQLLEKVLSREHALDGLSRREQMELLEVLWTYTHGLAAQVCVGAMALPDRQEIITRLRRVIDPLLACLHR
jgi:AcrR family transcriptional regulator